MSEASSRRLLVWAGSGLVAAAGLLNGGVLLISLGPLGLDESVGLTTAATMLRLALFGGGIALLSRGRRGAAAPYPRRLFSALALCSFGAVAAAQAFERTEGVLELLSAGLAVILLLLALRQALALLLGAVGSPIRVPRLRRPLLALAALTLVCTLLEVLLAGLARRPPAAGSGATGGRLVMPDALQQRDVGVEGARLAYWWQGKLHVFDAEGFRRTTPFPPKRQGVVRIMAVGDSLTYGYGVAAEDAWPAVLERALAPSRPVEVLNLGACGLQSEGVLDVVARFVPRLEPDVVVYGVCLNDFLPAGRGQYRNNRAWPVSFPGSFHLEHGTRLGAFVAERYDRLLMRLGVRADFYTDILRDFRGYQRRFARDVAAMNELVLARGLPPVVAMVLQQSPGTKGRGWRIAGIAEDALRAAGMTVVPAAGYFRANEGRDLSVSHWEGHPNEEAHRIFAGEILKEIAGR